MSIRHLPQKIKYHYKKYLAILFVSLAIAFIFTDLAMNLIGLFTNGVGSTLSTLNVIFNFFILMVGYIMILRGNIEGTGLAFQGVLSFVFLLLFSEILSLALDSISSSVSLIVLFANGLFLQGGILLAYYVLIVFQVVAGIFAYVRLRQYMTGRYVSSFGVKLWFFLYLGLFIAGLGLNLAFTFLSATGLNAAMVIFIAFLEPLSELCCAIACIFTVMRISD